MHLQSQNILQKRISTLYFAESLALLFLLMWIATLLIKDCTIIIDLPSNQSFKIFKLTTNFRKFERNQNTQSFCNIILLACIIIDSIISLSSQHTLSLSLAQVIIAIAQSFKDQLKGYLKFSLNNNQWSSLCILR